ILKIQALEGSMMLLAILLGSRTFVAALCLVDCARELLRSKFAQIAVAQDMAWWLIMSSYGALVALISGIAICQALDILSRAFGPFDGIRKFVLFGQLAPFFFLGLYLKARVGRRFAIDRVSVRPSQ